MFSGDNKRPANINFRSEFNEGNIDGLMCSPLLPTADPGQPDPQTPYTPLIDYSAHLAGMCIAWSVGPTPRSDLRQI